MFGLRCFCFLRRCGVASAVLVVDLFVLLGGLCWLAWL